MSGSGRGSRRRRRRRPREESEWDEDLSPHEAMMIRERPQAQKSAEGQRRPQPQQRQGWQQQGARGAGQAQRQGAVQQRQGFAGQRQQQGAPQAQRQGPPRLKWTPPVPPREPLPVPECPWCGKPIRELALALSDKQDSTALHFECVRGKIEEMLAVMQSLPDKGDELSYIGGGRFGIVHFNIRPDPPKDERTSRQRRKDERRARLQAMMSGKPREKPFVIKKIIEWENPDNRAPWRGLLSERYSLT